MFPLLLHRQRTATFYCARIDHEFKSASPENQSDQIFNCTDLHKGETKMIGKLHTSRIISKLLVTGIAILAVVFTMQAQVNTETKTTEGPTTRTATIEQGEIVYVSGNSVVVK